MNDHENTATVLAELYGKAFGGKPSGRFRIPQKILREIMGRRRLYDEDVKALTRALFEQGYVLIDMESFFIVMSANAFVNYRRVGKETLDQVRQHLAPGLEAHLKPCKSNPNSDRDPLSRNGWGVLTGRRRQQWIVFRAWPWRGQDDLGERFVRSRSHARLRHTAASCRSGVRQRLAFGNDGCQCAGIDPVTGRAPRAGLQPRSSKGSEQDNGYSHDE